jgi:phage baseplate assembly protein W
VSFDLAIQNGDLSLGSNDLRQVRNNTKLAQDVLKVLHTPVGSNPYFPEIGSYITYSNVGELLSTEFLEQKIEAQIIESLKQIQKEQAKQIARGQQVVPEEKLVNIKSLTATRDTTDPRQFNIDLSIQTGALDKQLDLSFSFSTTIFSE